VRLVPRRTRLMRMDAGPGGRSAMFARRRLVLRVQSAIVALAPGALHALLEADEAAIAAAAAGVAAAQILAPWIVLRMRGRIQTRRRDENSQTSKQIPHGRPPGLALSLLTPQAPGYFTGRPDNRALTVGHKQRGRAKAASHRIGIVTEGRLAAGPAPAAAVRAARPGESRPATRTEPATRRLLHDRRGVLKLRVAGAKLLGIRRQHGSAERERRRSQGQS
jgi:hypothetical protein